jgi:glyoxylase-like metal-dependent hydrolase (beta-lactamase superfamily II)
MLKASRYGDVIRIEMARSLLGQGWYWTSAYLVGQTLIDTGPAHTAKPLLRFLEDVPIRLVLNTHAHEDHIGANGALQRQRPDLRICAHPDAIPILKDPSEKQPLQFYRQLMWGWPTPCQANPIVEGEVLTDGEFHWQVLYTPGHTPHHVCFYEADHGWMFSGDLFVGGRDRALGAGNDIWQMINSLKLLAALPAKTLFPAAARVRQNPEIVLREKAELLQELGGKILDLHQKGWNENRIIKELLGGPMFIEFFTGGHFSRRHLLRSFLRRPDPTH